MNSIKLTIFTGAEDTDIIDLGLYNPEIEGAINRAYGGPQSFLSGFVNGNVASAISSWITVILNNFNNNPGDYAIFPTADLLAAQNYLTNLKIACDTYPACTVKIETL